MTEHACTLNDAMRALARYELAPAGRRPFETLSGGQQARLQILLTVTHDRWFAADADRYLIFRADGHVEESPVPVWHEGRVSRDRSSRDVG